MTTTSTRYYISSALPERYSLEGWINLIRDHWAGVEIRNHWRRDAAMKEDMIFVHTMQTPWLI